MFHEKDVLKNFAKFTGKHLCRSFFFNKIAGLRPVNLLNEELRNRCFPVNFAKFLETSFYRTPPGDCFCPWHMVHGKKQKRSYYSGKLLNLNKTKLKALSKTNTLFSANKIQQ